MTDKISGIKTGRREFIVLMAAMAALDAFSIDAMLPALDIIGDELGVRVDNQRQLVITTLFLGFSFGVLLYGFVSDSFGRRRPAIVGFVVFGMGSILCASAETFGVLLSGRVLQGLGAAGPYVLSVAIVRDLYRGRDMAQILSLVMMVFIGVPMIAPFIGQGLMILAGWRTIFTALLVFAMVTMGWFWFRQVETLSVDQRKPISFKSIVSSMREVFGNTQCLRYLFSLGAVSGAFIAYLSTGQQVFQDIFGLGHYFPVAFASLACLFGIASYFNSRWVHRMGSVKLVHHALSVITVASVIMFLCSPLFDGDPPLWSYILYMSFVMSAFAFLFGNLTTLALDPMGHIAGAASSLVNSLSTLIAITLAYLIGGQLQQNVYPVVVGFGVLSGIALLLNLPQYRKSAGSV